MRKLEKLLFIGFVLLCVCGFALSQRKEFATEQNGWNLILVNRDYYIPEDYKVELESFDNGEAVDSRIYPALQEMFKDAKDDGVHMFVREGYRTHGEQQELWDDKVEEYQEQVLVEFLAKWKAKKWVAIPGTSEHQLGLAVDINADISKSSSQEVYSWLAQNAYQYGFIQRYPADKTEITGISYEPWHYRYVGEDVAREMFQEGICLEEYVDKTHDS